MASFFTIPNHEGRVQHIEVDKLHTNRCDPTINPFSKIRTDTLGACWLPTVPSSTQNRIRAALLARSNRLVLYYPKFMIFILISSTNLPFIGKLFWTSKYAKYIYLTNRMYSTHFSQDLSSEIHPMIWSEIEASTNLHFIHKMHIICIYREV